MNYLSKLNQLLTSIDSIEDFVKISFVDYKIDEQTAREIIRLIKEAKNNALS